MWLLIVIVFLVSGEKVETAAHVLQTYTTEEECQSEQVRIEQAMLESYPDEPHSWELVCRINDRDKL